MTTINAKRGGIFDKDWSPNDAQGGSNDR